jgi:hypothetical protein
LFYEPLWVFSRGELLTRHEQLRSLRISIGPEGSASRALSLEFLARVGIIDQKSATLLPQTPQESAAKLLNGDIDAAILVDAWETPVVQQLLTAKEISLTNIRRADAFVALYPYLNKLVLPAGVANMAENRPPTDVLLLAPKASLVVRDDLHPSIQYLLLKAASQIHSDPGLFRTAGQFPAPESIELPLSTDARQFYNVPATRCCEPLFFGLTYSMNCDDAVALLSMWMRRVRSSPSFLSNNRGLASVSELGTALNGFG